MPNVKTFDDMKGHERLIYSKRDSSISKYMEENQSLKQFMVRHQRSLPYSHRAPSDLHEYLENAVEYDMNMD